MIVLLADLPLDAANAKTAGLSVEGLVTLCRNRTTDLIVSVLKMAFPPNTIDRYWFVMGGSGSAGCAWSNYPPAENCKYLKELLTKV